MFMKMNIFYELPIFILLKT